MAASTQLKTGFKSVPEYIATQPKAAQSVLRRVRGIIRKAVPGAKEVISYQIPAYKLPTGTVIFFAGWKEHFSLYPATGLVAKELSEELGPYKVSKGTIRFPLDEPVPVKLIERIARLRAKEVLAKPSPPRGRARSRS